MSEQTDNMVEIIDALLVRERRCLEEYKRHGWSDYVYHTELSIRDLEGERRRLLFGAAFPGDPNEVWAKWGALPFVTLQARMAGLDVPL